jgi:hypothetical protein
VTNIPILEVDVKIPLFVAGVLAFALPAQAADEAKAPKDSSLNEISLDIQALRSVRTFKLDEDQLKAIAKLAKAAAEPERKRNAPKASEDVRKAYVDFRAALIDDNDDDKIDQLDEELDQIVDKEKPELDDGFEVTKAAREKTREVFKALRVHQLASYYESIKDDVTEPLPHLVQLLDQVRVMDKAEWREKRDGFADDIANSVAGIDAAKGEKVGDLVVALLSKARALSAADFTMKKADLEKEAATIVGEIGPDELLRHQAERAIAEMLSNPRLEAVIKLKVK